MEKNQKVSIAKLNYLRIAPRKVRLFTNVLRGMNVVDAEVELLYRSNRPTGPVLKLLRSAISNAVNANFDKEKLYIKEIKVDGGPYLKRFLPRAQGRATSIHKKMSHITMVLAEKDQVIVKRYKVPTAKLTKSEGSTSKDIKEDKNRKEKVVKEKKQSKESKVEKSKGVTKKAFQRKAISG
jgi:large subunit ribosomal protein L22